MEKFFKLQENQSTVRTEVVAGITTFLAAMYIIIVNPAILSATNMPMNGLITATILVSAFSSIAMGLYANNPILLAPGMGLNAFFTYSVVLGNNVPWETALGTVFWSGIVFLLLSFLNVRTLIVQAIPKQLRYAIAAGIGIFISLIGFKNAQFIVHQPATLVGFGGLNWSTGLFMVGLMITSILVIKRFRGALIIGIILTTLLAVPFGRLIGSESLVFWKGIFRSPDFSLIGRLDLAGSLKFALWPTIFSFLFVDMFDSLSTFIGVAEAANLTDKNGEPRHIKESLIVDGLSTTISGLFGSSSGTSYIESAAGIEEGGRTGLTAVVSGLLFLPFLFLSPLIEAVPNIATAPALVLVGVFMMKPVLKINWAQYDDAIPAFLALLLIPLTYSITQGIVWGFLSWTLIKLLSGKSSEIKPTLLVIDLFAILSLFI
ncbi:MAG TPA: NCS2 family permease [bacterium]|jgi:AGZA family xanthine/uracil permease-like MFS transporter|nr:NCS2 family permease [bacterium]HNT66409.1 NCS2 family permease [bacterium]HOX87637.1 NCS2 family permease [bacterium]HPG47315.1 NCS2 family permease [bacterium]HPM99591.1 NCS2 family permease [bacterium]